MSKFRVVMTNFSDNNRMVYTDSFMRLFNSSEDALDRIKEIVEYNIDLAHSIDNVRFYASFGGNNDVAIHRCITENNITKSDDPVVLYDIVEVEECEKDSYKYRGFDIRLENISEIQISDTIDKSNLITDQPNFTISIESSLISKQPTLDQSLLFVDSFMLSHALCNQIIDLQSR